MLDERYLSQLPVHRSRLVRAAARLLGNASEAEDVVQDAYLRALEEGDKTELDVAQAWLTTVMQNLAVDRLRRRHWMQRWLRDADALAPETPSAETQAALTEEAGQALRLLATRLGAADGAAVLLREVFEASYSEIAEASGKTEAGCRQQVHRALVRLRLRDDEAPPSSPTSDEADTDTETVFRLYGQSLQQRDVQVLFGMLRQPATRAATQAAGVACQAGAPKAVCQVTHIGGRLGLVLRLGDQFVCVLPLGTRQEEEEMLAEAG